MDQMIKRGEDAGRRRIALRIIRHPATSTVLDFAAPRVRDLVPLEFAPDQISTADLALAVGVWPDVGAGWWYPPGSEILDPNEPPPKFPAPFMSGSLTVGPWSPDTGR